MDKKLQSALRTLVEKAGRPGVLGVAGRAIEKSCERGLRAYFNVIKDAVIALELENYVLLGTDRDIMRHSVEMRVRQVLRLHRELLLGVLRAHAESAFRASAAFRYMAEADPKAQSKRDKEQLGIDQLGQSAIDAAEWAGENAAQMVTGIEQTTIDQIAAAVAQGIVDRLGVDGTKRLIRQIMEDASAYRARMIASTEMNRAMSVAALEKIGTLGIEYKQVILSADACDICIDNAEQDPIPVDEEYESGDMAPPFHPNCRCAITGAHPPSGEEDTEGDDNET